MRGPVAETVTVYGPRPQGGRNLGVSLSGVTVLLSPADESHQEDAEHIALRLLGEHAERESLLSQLREAEVAAAALMEKLQHANEARRAAESRAESAITGRRRFFGPVLLVPASSGDWAGEVWLLDPDKRERGVALRFASVAEVRAAHPELWVAGAAHGGVLLDAWGAP